MKKLQKTNGLTLIELTIVLAIMAIIGAIVVPNFFNSTDRAKLRADVQSTILISNTFELYKIEKNTRNQRREYTNIADVLNILNYYGYFSNEISDRDLQTEGATWILENNKILLSLPHDNGTNNIRQLVSRLSDRERSILHNYD
ncbi:MAG: type II secretion system GspH family protein [Defluviitaleaceae bacterium]|nr:type II secretion system GspH family protein [Defluviitaleaceae bacterium]